MVFFVHRSTANFAFISVAVVITGVEFNLSAIRLASSFAPPRCPESRGITKSPCSSSTITAGSTSLDLICGAIYLTAIPVAPTKTKASYSLKLSAT